MGTGPVGTGEMGTQPVGTGVGTFDVGMGLGTEIVPVGNGTVGVVPGVVVVAGFDFPPPSDGGSAPGPVCDACGQYEL